MPVHVLAQRIADICQVHYTTLHYTTLHYTTLHYTTLHYTTLHYTTLHYTTLHYTTLHYTTLHYPYLLRPFLIHHFLTMLCFALLCICLYLLCLQDTSGWASRASNFTSPHAIMLNSSPALNTTTTAREVEDRQCISLLYLHTLFYTSYLISH